ncbi:MAG: tetratricopeptide repeat protein [Burkholderiales bacterium]|nr:MAG: tetratricopeptide repeat protein [Burkholderiales bacterium]
MKFPRVLLMCVALLSALWLGAAQALPNVDEVQAATQRGDYAAAEKMMREVVGAKPDSARAHYVLAEILAHERKFAEAREHASRARTLDPALKFTDPAKFSAFEQLLQRQQGSPAALQAPAVVSPAAPPVRAAPVERSESGGVPVWLLVGGVVVFIALAVRWMRNRTLAQGQPQPAYAGGYGAAPGGYGLGGVPPTAGSGGPGLMGVGLAAAGGVAAGMLAERLLHGDHADHDERSLPRDSGGGGLVPGSFGGDAGSAADDLAQRGIDFGSGDGWDNSSDSGGGSNDW